MRKEQIESWRAWAERERARGYTKWFATGGCIVGAVLLQLLLGVLASGYTAYEFADYVSLPGAGSDFVLRLVSYGMLAGVVLGGTWFARNISILALAAVMSCRDLQWEIEVWRLYGVHWPDWESLSFWLDTGMDVVFVVMFAVGVVWMVGEWKKRKEA